MKFKHFISSLFVCILLVISIVFFWTSCNRTDTETKDALKSNNIVLSLSEAETVEEDGAIYMERIARPSLADTEYLPTFGFKFSISWAEETDKELSEYLEITKTNLFTATLRIKQKFDEKVLFEIVSNPEGYYGAFLLTYEGSPTAIENLPSETSIKAGITQEYDLSSFNPLNPDASEEFNDFSVTVKYYGSIKTGEYLIVDENTQTFIEGSEKIYTDFSNFPNKLSFLAQAKIENNVLIISQEDAISNLTGLRVYGEGDDRYGVYEKFIECLSPPYAEVIVTENTSGYVQKIKVWMEV